MTFKDQRLAFAEIVNNHYSQEEKQSFYYLMTEHNFGCTKFEAHQKDNDSFPVEKEILFSEAIQRLEKNEPIQHIIGVTSFFDLPFKVNEHTLIPRPETEELIALILEDSKNNGATIDILDIGTGSGCIAITLASELKNAAVSGVDISEDALKVARENAELNEVNVTLMQLDILTASTLPGAYDVIVSNPPYVRQLEKSLMAANVLDYEPESALFVPDDNALLFYRKIAQLALLYLKEDGFLYFEINEYLGSEMMMLLEEIGFSNYLILKDIYSKDRMIRATR